MKRHLLFNHDPADGGSNAPAAPAPAPAPPPAAAAVMESGATEADAPELVKARREAEEAKRALKERETRISELEDENHRLKTPPPAAPAPKRGGGWTYFDDEAPGAD